MITGTRRRRDAEADGSTGRTSQSPLTFLQHDAPEIASERGPRDVKDFVRMASAPLRLRVPVISEVSERSGLPISNYEPVVVTVTRVDVTLFPSMS